MNFNSCAGSKSPEHTDVIIIGSGLAGGIIAYLLASKGYRVTALSNSDGIHDSNSYLAQGGIIYQGVKDSPDLLAYDIYRAGLHANNKEAVDLLTREGPRLVQQILIEKIGVPFDKTPDNEDFDYIEEGVHSVNRIIHCKDHTGKTIQQTLFDKLKKLENFQLLNNHTALELLSSPKGDQSICTGVLALNQKKQTIIPFLAPHTVLATGGLGQIFKHTTNSKYDRGDGIALASRIGAHIRDLEYIQFHPTSYYYNANPRFLISEALRGAGAKLINKRGERFMQKYHPDWELAPRDVVARAIHQEMTRHNTPSVYLDISFKDGSWITDRFPQIFQYCLDTGIDIRKDYIPVVPAAHYSCGGVSVDTWGRTTIQNLWAAGEVASTGLHGANRLASTSLLECVVWGYRCFQNISSGTVRQSTIPPLHHSTCTGNTSQKEKIVESKNIDSYTRALKEITWSSLGLIRTPKKIKDGMHKIDKLLYDVESLYRHTFPTDPLAGLYNSMYTARLVLQSALQNRRSLGCHYIVDDE